MATRTSRAVWRKSSRSSPNGDNCVETAALTSSVAVRDSKAPDGGNLTVSTGQWKRFMRSVKDDRL